MATRGPVASATLRRNAATGEEAMMVSQLHPHISPAEYVALRLGVNGVCQSIESACAASAHAIGHAAILLADRGVLIAVDGRGVGGHAEEHQLQGMLRQQVDRHHGCLL